MGLRLGWVDVDLPDSARAVGNLAEWAGQLGRSIVVFGLTSCACTS